MSNVRALTIEFLDEEPQGLRLITQSNLSIEFLLCSRSRLTQTLGKEDIWNRLDGPGVYILIGPSELQPEHDKIYEALYIGQSDSVAERLDSHLKSKLWWQTAIIFKRKNPLNLSNCKYLESRLYKLALEAGKCVLLSLVQPQLPAMSSAEIDNTEDFLRKIQVFLSAFGWDFLERAQVIPPKPGDQPLPSPPPPLPLELSPVFKELQIILDSFPKAKCYQTRIPDYRAKVVDGEGSRAFAGLKWAKHWVWLELYRGGKHKVAKLSDIDETIRAAITKAYELAQESLQTAKPK